MEIDWLTVGAQIVNFLVLVWILQHFLYRPIIEAMDRREQRIADRLQEAAKKSEEAENEAQLHRKKREQLEAQREETLAKAKEEAERLRKSLSDDIRDEFEDKKRRWNNQVESEREEFLQDLRRRTSEQFIGMARHALKAMANTDLVQQISEVFIERLRVLDEDKKRQFAEALADSDDDFVVRSSFELPANLRRRLTRAIHDTVADDAEVRYETSPDVACGIETRVGSQVLAWSLDGYLDTLEANIAERMRQSVHVQEHRKAG
jgi:F-type H+-transporting ATPase subunit b